MEKFETQDGCTQSENGLKPFDRIYQIIKVNNDENQIKTLKIQFQ